MNKPIAVGIDGTPQSRPALELASLEAAMRRRPLQIVHALAWPWPTFHMPDRPPPQNLEAISLLAEANTLIATAVQRANQCQPAVTTSGDVMIGFAAQVLSAASQTATMVVIGTRGLGSLDRLLLGSVAAHLRARAACPVLVSRGRRNPAGNVLLIIDREPNSTLVQAAVEEAALRGVGIETLRISHAPVISARPMRRLETTTRNRVQPALPHIIETTAQAQVAVVCTRASGNRGHLPLTSISQTLLNHAACPVLVVPCGNQPASV